MECAIPQRVIKLFVKSLRTLAKVGPELFLEATEDALVLRALNDSRSAYLSLSIDKSFFSQYTIFDAEDVGKIKLQIKSCVSVFRNSGSIETCYVAVKPEDCRVVFTLLCKHGVKKLYMLTYEEQKPIRAIYDEETGHVIVARPRLIMEALQNFQANTEEITMDVHSEHLELRSFVDPSKEGEAGLETKLIIESSDFEEYPFRYTEKGLTFCLKETRAFLGYAENAAQNATIRFDRPGRAMLLMMKYFNLIDATMVLATMVQPEGNNNNDEHNNATGNSGRSTSDSAASSGTTLTASSSAGPGSPTPRSPTSSHFSGISSSATSTASGVSGTPTYSNSAFAHHRSQTQTPASGIHEPFSSGMVDVGHDQSPTLTGTKRSRSELDSSEPHVSGSSAGSSQHASMLDDGHVSGSDSEEEIGSSEGPSQRARPGGIITNAPSTRKPLFSTEFNKNQ